MKPVRRVTQIWNWLPAFRAVAETQHLPTASKETALSASALSRAVRLLEEQLELQLFIRDGRNLVLDPAGRLLLDAVRLAMRRIDDALDGAQGTTMAGPVQISAPGPYASIFVLPAIQALWDEHPDLVPHLGSIKPSEVGPKLLDGSLDLAMLDDPQPQEGLVVHLLGRLSFGLYCSPLHPLSNAKSVTLSQLAELPFVGPPNWLDDHFPPHVPRRIGMVVEHLHVAVQACATSSLLGFLPDAVADAYRGDGQLKRLPIELAAPLPLYAVHRAGLLPQSRVLTMRQAIEETLRATSRHSRPGSVRPPSPDDT